MPTKFESGAALAKSYLSLEKSYSRSQQDNAELRSQNAELRQVIDSIGPDVLSELAELRMRVAQYAELERQAVALASIAAATNH